MIEEERCELGDLPVSMCACRRHRGGIAPGDRVAETSTPFVARYSGRCDVCEGPIEEGETIVRLTSGGYIHRTRRCLP